MNAGTDTVILDEHQKALLVDLAGVLLPGTDRDPGAADVLKAGDWLQRAIAAHRPLQTDIGPALAVASLLEGPPETVARTLFTEHPAEFETLSLAISGAYYMVPEVHAALGWQGQTRRFASALEAADDLDDEIFGPMLESPSRYRTV